LSYEPAVETPAPALSEAELVQQAFAKRTDLQRLGLDIRGARLSVRQAQAQAKPGVLLSGGYARSGEAATITESYGRLENPSWSVGLVTNVSLDLKADRAAIAQAQSSLRLAELNEKLRRDEVRLWIRRLLRELGDADANAVLLGETVQIAQENLRIRQVQFEHGLIRAVDVMQTERQLNETRDQYLNAVIDRELARARLRLAIGEMPLS
jgi:outer membrane protein TolC